MGIRPGRSVRDMDKVAWTRFSKTNPRRSYIKAMPHKDLNVFRMGAMKPGYTTEFDLVCEGDIILRDNAIESARQTANKHMEKNTPMAYYFIVRVYPHHVTRENKMISGAGADRLQKGMRQSFGRPVDRAARVNKGQPVFTIYTIDANAGHARAAFTKARKKLSGSFKIKTRITGERIGT